MPIVNIYVQDCWDDPTIKKMSDAVHDALVEAFQIPAHDYNHRVIVIPKDRFFHAENKTDQFVFIEIHAFPGRSKKAKQKLYSILFDRFGKFGLTGNDMIVIINEPPLVDWGMNGRPGDEADIGFKLDV